MGEHPAVSRVELEVDEPAPDFVLMNSEGTEVTLMNFRGRRVVLYFYPAAGTPGCTAEACDFRDNLAALNDAGVEVVGISPDPPERLEQFREAQRLTFPLLSDETHKVALAFGAWGEKQNYGRTVTGIIRSTFVIGPSGLIERAYYNVRATGHVVRLLRDLGLGPSDGAPSAP